MKELDQLVENFFQPKRNTLGLDQLVEMVEQVMGEAVDEDAVEAVKKFAEKKGYEFTKPFEDIIKIRSEDREAAREEFLKAIGPGGELEEYGFVFQDVQSQNLGRIVKRGERGKYTQLVILFKHPIGKGSGGASAAEKGYDLENQLASLINDRYSDEGIEAKSAGAGSGSDLTIKAEGKKELKIEIKTSLSADFGQFRLYYDTELKKWEPNPTKGYKKNIEIFKELFDAGVGAYMDKTATFPNLEHPNLRIKDKKVHGLKSARGTSELKKQLQSLWFDKKTDLKIKFDFKRLAKYYANKGDEYIQVGRKGLYALNKNAANELDIPLFENSGLKGKIRIRLKPSSGSDSSHSFTVAVKVSGVLQPSNLSLLNPEDIETIINRYKNTP